MTETTAVSTGPDDDDAVEVPVAIGGFIDSVAVLRSGSTKENRTRHARDFGVWLLDRGLAPTDVGVPDAEDYIQHLGGQDYAPMMVDNIRWSLTVLYDYLVPRTEMDANPFSEADWSRHKEILNGTKKAKHVEARGGIYALDRDGVAALADHVPGSTCRNRLLVLLMYHTGVRVQELADMKLADVDRDERKIEVYSKKLDTPHTDAEPRRPVWYGASLDKHLTQWLDYGDRDGFYHADASPYLFCSNSSERLSTRHINKIIVDAAWDADLQDVMYQDVAGRDRHLVTSHTLRHSFAYECMQSTESGARIDLKTLADLMGHQSTETTEKYLVFAESDLRESRRLYGPS